MFERWKLLILLVLAIACAAVVPRVDVLETAYSEVDIPINHAYPVVPGIKLTQPHSASILLSKKAQADTRHQSSVRLETFSSRVLTYLDSHSTHALLCTFLI